MKNPYLVVIDVQERLFPVMNEKEAFLKKLQIRLWDIPYYKILVD